MWSRLDKRIPISPEVRAVLRLDAGVDQLSPPELIRAILQAPVALLFAGGIGTFVRASDEPDREIDDRANAEVRVTGSQVRARVVGEGANLAFTQRARIEYARRGGHINTDAIDNSAGVDISDREVNLKILLRPAVEAGEITLAGAGRAAGRRVRRRGGGRAARQRPPEHGPEPVAGGQRRAGSAPSSG